MADVKKKNSFTNWQRPSIKHSSLAFTQKLNKNYGPEGVQLSNRLNPVITLCTTGCIVKKCYTLHVLKLIELYFNNFNYFSNFRPFTCFSVMIPETVQYNFCHPDDEHMCSKHVEAWNKLIIKFSASSWLILRNKHSTSYQMSIRFLPTYVLLLWLKYYTNSHLCNHMRSYMFQS